MTDRDAFEQYVSTWLWMVDGTLARLGHGYENRGIQLAWQCWMESRRGGFVSSGFVDIEIP